MKKIFSLIALLWLSCLSSVQVQAQTKKWVHHEEPVTEIKSGTDYNYVLKQGINTNGLSNGSYLNNGKKSRAKINESCIYNFIEDGEKICGEETFKLYVLKNKENGKYLSETGDIYVGQKELAFHFAARLCREITQEEIPGLAGNWLSFSNAVREQTCPGSETGHAWVLCGTEENVRRYISFFEGTDRYPNVLPYLDTNSWFIHEAYQVDITPFEQLNTFFEKYYTTPITEENYPVGSAPGCIDQDVYDDLLATYNILAESVSNENLTQTECDQLKKRALDSFDRYKRNIHPVTEGYFMLINEAYDRVLTHDLDGAISNKTNESWDLEKARFVWHLTKDPKKENRFFFRNWGTNKYLANAPAISQQFKIVEEPKNSFSATLNNQSYFVIRDGNDNVMHNASGADVVWWNNGYDWGKPSHWKFEPVDKMIIDTLSAKVSQHIINKKLAVLIAEVENEVNGLKINNGVTFDGNYAKNKLGLANKALRANATERNEGSIEGLFDGDVNTFYHTAFKEECAPENGLHWVEVDLGHEVKELYIKFTDRISKPNRDKPTAFALVAPGPNEFEDNIWSDTLYKQENISYNYSSFHQGEITESATSIEKITLPHPVQYVRFTATKTTRNKYVYTTGPTWNLSELHFYDAAECTSNPRLDMVPKEVLDKLNEILAIAKEEVNVGKSTLDTYEKLDTAIKTFRTNYPDPTVLEEAIKNAESKANRASESIQTFGYYKTGAKSQFLESINNIKNNIQNKILTLDELNKFTDKLATAEQTFDNNLIVPENGKVYRIFNNAGFDEDGNERLTNGSCLASLNADVNGELVGCYKEYEGVNERFNTLWLIEKNEKGFAFKNIANGLYVKNPLENLKLDDYESVQFKNIGYSATPSYFKIGAFKNAGSLVIETAKGYYLNLLNDHKCNHLGKADAYETAFTFREITDGNGFTNIFSVDITPGKTQILTLPFDINSAFTENNSALKVIGIKNNSIQLNPYDAGETISAGTPFIIVSAPANLENDTEAESIAYMELPYKKVNDYMNIDYVRTPVIQNGLISAPSEVILDAGYGLLIGNGNVIATLGGETVPAKSGFFDKSIPITDIDGEYSLEVKGDITGEWTAIDGIALQHNDNQDIYTLSGVKIANHTKYSEVKNKLAKGIYIIGGKIMIVK